MEEYEDSDDERDHPLKTNCKSWETAISRAWEFKEKEFQDDADDCMRFFCGSKDDFWDASYARGARGFMAKDGGAVQVPEFQIKVMKVSEGTQLFGPALYASNPQGSVTARRFPKIGPEAFGIPPEALQPPDPTQPPNPELAQYGPAAMQFLQLLREDEQAYAGRDAAAKVMETIINYYQGELNKKWHARRIIDEALIKGMGVAWHEVVEFPASGQRMIGSFYDSVDRLILDPDAECDEEIQWMGRKRVMSVRDAEKKFGAKRGQFQKYAQIESVTNQSMTTDSPAEKWRRKTGRTRDIIVFWEIYSKMGMGDDLPGMPKQRRNKYRQYGQYVYLAICPGCPYPLNIPPGTPEEEMFKRLAWPIPFHEEKDGWPCSRLSFHPVPGRVYPKGHFFDGLGHIKWLTWAMSFLAGKVKTSCNTFIGVLKAAGANLKEALESNTDNKLIELESTLGKKIGDVVSFLQQPPFHGDIWNVVAAVAEDLNRLIGTAEIMYGMGGSTQDRSATETRLKNENAGARVSDMRTRVEEWLSEVMAKEAIAIGYLIDPADVQPMIGGVGAAVYALRVKPLSMTQLAREFQYDIVAGSTARKSKLAKAQDALAVLEKMGGPAASLATQGMPQSWNAMTAYVCENTLEIRPQDYQQWMIQPPPPPDPSQDPKVMAEQQKANTEMLKFQLEQQIAQAKLAIETEKHQADMASKEADMMLKGAEIEGKKQEMQMKLAAEQAKIQLAQEKARVDIETERAKAASQLEIESVKGAVAIRTQQAQSAATIATQTAESGQKLAQGREESKQKLEAGKAQAKANVEATKAKAKAKPQPKSKGKDK